MMATKLERLMTAAGLEYNKDKLGRLVRKAWVKKEESAAGGAPSNVIKARSLGAKLGQLEAGDTVWWDKRPLALEALADCLSVAPGDIVGRASSGQLLFEFEEFPELAPLNLRTEALPPGISFREDSYSDFGRLSEYDWERYSPESKNWFRMPPGTGKRLLARWLQARGLYHVVEVATLAEAVPQIDMDEPNFVRVEQQDPTNDAAALHEISRLARATVKVVAPFSLPATPNDRRMTPGAWDTRHDPVIRRDVANAWTWLGEQIWMTGANWRREYVEWMVDRLEVDSLLSAQGLLEWLDEADPGRKLFATPSSLLSLGHYVHHHDKGEHALRQASVDEIAEWWIARRSELQAEVSEVRAAWLRLFGVRAAKALARRRLDCLDKPLDDTLPRHWWEASLPAEFVSRRLDESEVAELRANIENSRSKAKRREQVNELIAQLEEPRAPETIDLLQDAGLLREAVSNRLRFAPAWLGHWLQRDQIERALVETPSRRWGAQSVDRARRRLFDDALDELADDDFHSVCAEVVRTFDEDNYAQVAALEAIFAAVGRRLGQQEVALPGELLSEIANLQMRCLTPRTYRPLGPMTRLPREPYEPIRRMWISCGWAWSAYVSAPDDLDKLDFGAWRQEVRTSFPGWFQPRLDGEDGEDLFKDSVFAFANPPSELKEATGREAKWLARQELASQVYFRFLKLAPAVLNQYRSLAGVNAIPEVFAGAVILAAAQDKIGARALCGSGAGILLSHTAVDVFLEQTEALNSEEHKVAAMLLWRSYTSAGRIDTVASETPALADYIFEHLQAEVFRESIDEMGRRAIVTHINVLPPRLREELLDWELARDVDGLGWVHLRQVLRYLGPNDIDSVIRLAQEGDPQAAHMVWNWKPQLALEHARTSMDETQRALAWYRGSPVGALPQLLDIAEQTPAKHRPDWLGDWLFERLPAAGQEAERVYSLYRQAVKREKLQQS